jgi:hypothetical protein
MGQPKLTNLLPVNKTEAVFACPIKRCIEHSKKMSEVINGDRKSISIKAV